MIPRRRVIQCAPELPLERVTFCRVKPLAARAQRGQCVRVRSGMPNPDDEAASAAKAGLIRVYDEIASTYGTLDYEFFELR